MTGGSRPWHPALSPLGVAGALAGVLLFAYTIHQTGVAPIVEGVRRVGLGFIAIVTLAGLRFLARAWAWTLCTDEEDPGLRLRDTFPALVTGDALGNLTPLGLFVSEPAKAALVRRRVSLMSALSGIAIENIFYTLTVAIVIAAGTAALLFEFDVPQALRHASLAALGGVVAIVLIGGLIVALQIKLVSGTIAWLGRRNLGPASLRERLEKLRALEDSIYGFHLRHPARALPILLLECTFHVLGVVEVWITLVLLLGAAAPGLLTTFILEAVNRTITVVFKFVPLRIGVDEAGTELLARTLGLGTGIGVTLAIVRKVRMLFWTAIGVALLVRRGLAGTLRERAERAGG
jgi:hypothetical protein